MYEKFGEFDSVEELNRAAAAQKEQGDEEALYALAGENGIDREEAEDYWKGEWEPFATAQLAALGKLEVEAKDLRLGGVLLDWVDELKRLCVESGAFAIAVRHKGKDLAGYIALTAESGYEHRAVVDQRIVARAPEIKRIVGHHEFAIGIPDRKTRKELAMQYYRGDAR